MDQTLPRRGIEDSMYPKPTERKPLFDLGRFFELFMADSEPIIVGKGLRRRTVTVLVEYDPALTDESTVAREMFERLRPSTNDLDGTRRLEWRVQRTHPWNTPLSWVPKS